MRCYRKEFITIDGVGAIDGVFTPGAMSLRRLPLIRHEQGLAVKGSFVMRAVNTDARSTTRSRMMFTVKQIAPRRTVTCPAHDLGLGMA